MHRYKITIEYNGTPYHGWQRVDDGPSIQSMLEDAVKRFCGEAVQVIGAGRTDSGVHAAAQVAHIDLPRHYDAYRVMNALNFHLINVEDDENALLLRTIAVTSAEEVSEEFHARFSATARHYEYRILNRRAPTALHAGKNWHVWEPLDIDAMQEAANTLMGHHDFTTFRDSKCQAKSPMKTLDYLTVKREGDIVSINTGARSFLHHQVRIMVGTLRMVGCGKWSVDDMRNALLACDRRAGGPTAPAHGLCLMRVDY